MGSPETVTQEERYHGSRRDEDYDAAAFEQELAKIRALP